MYLKIKGYSVGRNEARQIHLVAAVVVSEVSQKVLQRRQLQGAYEHQDGA